MTNPVGTTIEYQVQIVSGVATLDLPTVLHGPLQVGGLGYSVYMDYTGLDANGNQTFEPIVNDPSPPLTVTVAPAGTTVVDKLVGYPSPEVYGETFTINATVTSTVPTPPGVVSGTLDPAGSVNFYDSTVNIQSASWASSVATITTSSIPSEGAIAVGQTITITGMTSTGPGSYNGTFVVNSVVNNANSTTFTYALGTNPGTAAAYGVVDSNLLASVSLTPTAGSAPPSSTASLTSASMSQLLGIGDYSIVAVYEPSTNPQNYTAGAGQHRLARQPGRHHGVGRPDQPAAAARLRPARREVHGDGEPVGASGRPGHRRHSHRHRDVPRQQPGAGHRHPRAQRGRLRFHGHIHHDVGPVAGRQHHHHRRLPGRHQLHGEYRHAGGDGGPSAQRDHQSRLEFAAGRLAAGPHGQLRHARDLHGDLDGRQPRRRQPLRHRELLLHAGRRRRSGRVRQRHDRHHQRRDHRRLHDEPLGAVERTAGRLRLCDRDVYPRQFELLGDQHLPNRDRRHHAGRADHQRGLELGDGRRRADLGLRPAGHLHRHRHAAAGTAHSDRHGELLPELDEQPTDRHGHPGDFQRRDHRHLHHDRRPAPRRQPRSDHRGLRAGQPARAMPPPREPSIRT